MNELIPFPEVQYKIATIRKQHVMADADVAELYGVETRRVNDAVKNNSDKFPKDYMFELDKSELQDLRSKISTTNVSSKSRSTTKVFTEKGLYMLATILKSEKASAATFAIIETFAKVRELKHELVELHKESNKEVQTKKMQHFGDLLTDIVISRHIRNIYSEGELQKEATIAKNATVHSGRDMFHFGTHV